MRTGILMLQTKIPHLETIAARLSQDGEVYANYPLQGASLLMPNLNLPANKFDCSTVLGRQLAFICAKRFDRLLIASQRPIPKILAYTAVTELSAQSVRFLVNNKVVNGASAEALKRDPKLANQYQNLFNQPESQTYTAPNGIPLRSYQNSLVDFALQRKRVGLFVDMGLGKTLSTLEIISQAVKTGQLDVSRPILVVAPIMVALDTWSREAKKWGYDFDVLVNIHLSGKKRDAMFDKILTPHQKPTLVTTNPAQLGPLYNYLLAHHQPHLFQMAVVDELSQFKAPRSQRLQYLTNLTAHCDYFLGLTGTPAPNNLLDIYSEISLISPSLASDLGYNFYNYRSRFFKPSFVTKTGIACGYVLRSGASERIYDTVKSNVISLRSSGRVDLPKITFDERFVKLPPKAQALYTELDTEIRKEFNDTDNAVTARTRHQEITVANSAVLTSKLLQLSSGAIYDTNSSTYTVYQDEKFKMLKDIVDNCDSPVLIFFYFKSELERMKKCFKFEFLDTKRKDAQDLIARWNRGEVPVMVAHPASAGHGLNLQEGGHIMVWLTLPWSNEQYRQSIKRLYRSGQTDPVNVIHIVAEDTVDEEVLSKLDLKEAGQNELMEALERD